MEYPIPTDFIVLTCIIVGIYLLSFFDKRLRSAAKKSKKTGDSPEKKAEKEKKPSRILPTLIALVGIAASVFIAIVFFQNAYGHSKALENMGYSKYISLGFESFRPFELIGVLVAALGCAFALLLAAAARSFVRVTDDLARLETVRPPENDGMDELYETFLG